MEKNLSINLSVILPVLNNRFGFEKTLKSILKQDQPSIEIIVIDGGSNDGTLEFINNYKKNINYFETGKDRGIADAFNRGISKASGDIIAILNSDDVWLNNTLGQLQQRISTDPEADIYYGAIEYVDNKKKYNYVRQANLSSMRWRMSIFHPAMFVRKSLYMRIGLYDESYTHAMDSEWCHRALVAGAKFSKVPATLAKMSLGGTSDIDFITSLRQYRDSTIKHGLNNWLSAHFYFYFYVAVKWLMRQNFMFFLKRLRDKFISKKHNI